MITRIKTLPTSLNFPPHARTVFPHLIGNYSLYTHEKRIPPSYQIFISQTSSSSTSSYACLALQDFPPKKGCPFPSYFSKMPRSLYVLVSRGRQQSASQRGSRYNLQLVCILKFDPRGELWQDVLAELHEMTNCVSECVCFNQI